MGSVVEDEMLVKRGNYWYGSVRVNGRSSRLKTTGCRDKAAALAVLSGWERAAADPAFAASQSSTVAHAVKAVLDHYQALVLVGKKSAATESYYADKLGTVARVLDPLRTLSTIDARVIDQYVSRRRTERASEHCISKEMGALRLVLRAALRWGTFSGNLDAIFPRFDRNYQPRDRTLTSEEVSAMLGVLPNDHAARLAFSIATSAEAKALQAAQTTDVSENGMYVLVRGTKRELRWRTVPIVTPWQKDLLEIALRRAEGLDPFLFRATGYGFRSALRNGCRKLGIDHFSPNDLRRTFAVRMRESGFPLELIAPLMGHADTKMLQRVYGRLNAEQLRERLVMALNALSPMRSGVLQEDAKRLNAAHWPAASSSETHAEAPQKEDAPGRHVHRRGPVSGGFHYKAHWLDEPDGWILSNEPIH